MHVEAAAERGPYCIAKCSLRGTCAAQLQGLTGSVNETTNNRHATVGCWWFHAELLARAICPREMRHGGPELLAHYLGGRSVPSFSLAVSGDSSTLPTIARHEHACSLARVVMTTSLGRQSLTRRLARMAARQAQANATISRLGRQATVPPSGISGGTPSPRPSAVCSAP